MKVETGGDRLIQILQHSSIGRSITKGDPANEEVLGYDNTLISHSFEPISAAKKEHI